VPSDGLSIVDHVLVWHHAHLSGFSCFRKQLSRSMEENSYRYLLTTLSHCKRVAETVRKNT
jgi:hypothetical protein